MKLSKLALILVFSFIVTSCVPKASPEPFPTVTPLPKSTSTPGPTQEPTLTPTVDYSEMKHGMAEILVKMFDVPENNMHFESITWEGDTLQLKGYLANYFIEPKTGMEHSSLHFKFINTLGEIFQKPAYKSFLDIMQHENTSIVFISRGLISQAEMLSETSFQTFQDIMNKKITTEIEWIRDSEIISN